MDTKAVGEKLVAFCKEGRTSKRLQTCMTTTSSASRRWAAGYAAGNARHRGCRRKNEWWINSHEVPPARPRTLRERRSVRHHLQYDVTREG